MITKKSLLISADGGNLSILRDGEVVLTFPIPAGRVPVSEYWDYLPDGCIFFTSDLGVLNPRTGFGFQSYGEGSHHSGANPDFRPTSASRMEMQMRAAVSQMQETTRRLDAREKALALVERMPTNVEPSIPQEPVLEAVNSEQSA